MTTTRTTDQLKSEIFDAITELSTNPMKERFAATIAKVKELSAAEGEEPKLIRNDNKYCPTVKLNWYSMAVELEALSRSFKKNAPQADIFMFRLYNLQKDLPSHTSQEFVRPNFSMEYACRNKAWSLRLNNLDKVYAAQK